MGRLLLVVLVLVAVDGREPSSCPTGYRPFSCTVCIKLTENERQFSETVCPSSGVTLVLDDVRNESHVLQRYLEVFNKQQLWTGYELSADGEPFEPNTNQKLSLPIIGNETCRNCCLAWQLHPYGLVRVDCDKELPAICTTSVTLADTFIGESSGLGQSSYVSVYIDDVLQPDMQSHHIKFGSTITLNCSSEDDVDVQWYLNDKQINKDNPSSVLVLSFRQSGYYQCKVNGNLLGQERSVLLCGVDGEPGDVEQLTASAYSQTELIVTWFPPDNLGTSDPLLLRYNLFYSSMDIIDEESKQMMSVIPQLSGGNVTMKVPNLRKGTKYVIGVVATSTVMPMAEKYPTLNTVVSTYGEAPAESVSGLKIQPLKDDEKALRVSWDTPQLSSPEGPVSLYEVEYRDGKQGLSNKADVPPDKPFFVIHGVENYNNYEVRVAILVDVSQDPSKRDRSEWTEWIGVNSTGQPSTEKGEIKPTNTADDGTDVDVIVAAVLLPLAVLLVLILLLGTCLFFCFLHKTQSKQSYSVQKEERSESEGKKMTSTDV